MSRYFIAIWLTILLTLAFSEAIKAGYVTMPTAVQTLVDTANPVLTPNIRFRYRISQSAPGVKSDYVVRDFTLATRMSTLTAAENGELAEHIAQWFVTKDAERFQE